MAHRVSGDDVVDDEREEEAIRYPEIALCAAVCCAFSASPILPCGVLARACARVG